MRLCRFEDLAVVESLDHARTVMLFFKDILFCDTKKYIVSTRSMPAMQLADTVSFEGIFQE